MARYCVASVTNRIVSDEKSNDKKGIKLVVIGPKICENSHSYFQNWVFSDQVIKINLKYPYLDSLRRNFP